MKAVNIMWDTDGDKDILNELPKEMELPQDIDADEIGDYLSDETGYCHFGYQLEESYYMDKIETRRYENDKSYGIVILVNGKSVCDVEIIRADNEVVVHPFSGSSKIKKED